MATYVILLTPSFLVRCKNHVFKLEKLFFIQKKVGFTQTYIVEPSNRTTNINI